MRKEALPPLVYFGMESFVSGRSKQSERAAMEATENGQDQRAESEKALQATQDSLDQVRDILVGSQLRQQDRRFAQLEEKVAAQIATFAQQQKQESAGYSKASSNLNSPPSPPASPAKSPSSPNPSNAPRKNPATSRATTCKNWNKPAAQFPEEARNGLDKLAGELHSAAGALESRVVATEQQQASIASELRATLFDQTKNITEQSQAQRAELLAMIEKLGTELRAAKPDRATLAGIFTDMAARLQG